MEHTQWQSLLKKGNDCFHDQQWHQAEYFYAEAYDLLAFSYRNNPLCSETLMAWICSCHNLSSLYEQIDKLDLALRFLLIPHDYLTEITESKVPDQDVKLLAFKGMTITLNPILLFAKKHPMCEDCLTRFESLQHLLEQEPRQIH